MKLLLLIAIYKLCTLLLNVRAISFMMAARRLSPQVEAIKAAHPNDLLTANKLVAEFYKQNGLNPAVGCQVRLVDFLFFLGFLCFASPQTFLRGSGFFWVPDVTNHDSLIPMVWLGVRYLEELAFARIDNRDLTNASIGVLIVGAVIWGMAKIWQWPAYAFAFWILMHFFQVVIVGSKVLIAKSQKVAQPSPAPAQPPAPASPPATAPAPASPPARPSPPAPSPPTVPPARRPQPTPPRSPHVSPTALPSVSPPAPPVAPSGVPRAPGQAALPPTPAAKPFDLPAEIAQVSPGSTIKIDPPRQHVQGPIVIDKPIVIEGQGERIWAAQGPVVSIQSDGVVLRNVSIEITDNTGQLSGAAASALVVRNGLNPVLDQVSVRGDADGVAGEEGVWRYPRAIVLGLVEAGRPHEFRIRLAVPVRCKLVSEIAGLVFHPQEICHPEEVTLRLDALPAGTRLRGTVSLRAPTLNRTIFVTGSIAASGSGAAAGNNRVIYEPNDWDTVRRAPPPQPKSRPAQPVPVTTSPPGPAPATHPVPAATSPPAPAPVSNVPLAPTTGQAPTAVPPATGVAPQSAATPTSVPTAPPPQSLRDSVFGAPAAQAKVETQSDDVSSDASPPAEPPDKTGEAKPSQRRRSIRGGGIGAFGNTQDKGPA